MTYYKDLTNYTYTDIQGPMLNVGWLDAEHNYPKGESSERFVHALQLLCKKPTNLMRGFHVCQFCAPTDEIAPLAASYRETWDVVARGNGEIHVTGPSGIVFCAPTLIYHYIVKHKYLPPNEFIEAVLYQSNQSLRL